MDFSSDNAAGAAPEIMAALVAANRGPAAGYGADAATARLERRFAALFEHEVAVFPVATGTAANALALAALTPPWGIIYCHEHAHIAVNECGAPEFFAGGAKLIGLGGERRQDHARRRRRAFTARGFVHHAQPAAISLSQSTEAGAVYAAAEIASMGEFARRVRLWLHVDGARFANAVAGAGLRARGHHVARRRRRAIVRRNQERRPRRRGGDLFDPERARDFGYRRKRGGHLVSKMRFVSAQLEAYLKDGLWLRNARHANAMAQRLAAALVRTEGARLRHPVEANEVFVELPDAVIVALAARGFKFHRWGGADALCIRLVASFATTADEVDALVAAIGDEIERREN